MDFEFSDDQQRFVKEVEAFLDANGNGVVDACFGRPPPPPPRPTPPCAPEKVRKTSRTAAMPSGYIIDVADLLSRLADANKPTSPF